MPMNRVPRITAMPIMVKAAFLASGFLNAETPFEMTSTPVSAVQPDEKARRRRNSVNGRHGRSQAQRFPVPVAEQDLNSAHAEHGRECADKI